MRQKSFTNHWVIPIVIIVVFYCFFLPPEGEKIKHLEAGEHNFPFQFQLPTSPLPAPFVRAYGEIRYKIYASIMRSTFKTNYVTEKCFMVTNPVVDISDAVVSSFT